MSKAVVVVADSLEKIPTAPVDGRITTVYWNICGLGQSIRYALELAGVPYTDLRIDPGPGAPGTPEYKGFWFGKKAEVGQVAAFPNLPYLLDGDVALVQSNTILRYIGRKYDLLGEPGKTHLVDLVLDQAADFDGASTGLSYRGSPEDLKAYCQQALPAQLVQWSKFLGDKPFMTGEKVTVGDLKVYETLRKLKLIEELPEVGTKTLASFPNLVAFLARIEALPQLKSYFASEQYMSRPLNNPHANFR